MFAALAPSNPDTLLHGTGKLRLDWTLHGLLPASGHEPRTYWAAGPAWSDMFMPSEPLGGLGNYTDKPQMGILTQHLALS